MTVQVGKFHHEDGTYDFALAEDEPEGEGMKVVVFPEPGGSYDVHHNVPVGAGGGEWSAS
jgi:hypothetical protein